MNIRYVISHMNKDGMRVMTNALQGRNTRATKEEAQEDLKNFLTNNSEETFTNVFGKQSIGTFEVSAVECYPEHNDPKAYYIQMAPPEVIEHLEAFKEKGYIIVAQFTEDDKPFGEPLFFKTPKQVSSFMWENPTMKMIWMKNI